MSYEAPYELPAIPRQHTLIGAGGFIESQDFVSGSSGWRIDGSGNFEGNNGNFRGDITGASGTFESALSVGSGNNIFRVDTDGDMWIGHATQGSAPFQVTKAGVLTASSGTFSGDVTAANIRTASSGTRIEMLSGTANIMALHTANSVSSYPGQVTVNEGTDGTHGDHSNFQLLAPAMTGSTRPGITIQHFDDGDSRILIGTDDSDPQIALYDFGGDDKIGLKGQIIFEESIPLFFIPLIMDFLFS